MKKQIFYIFLILFNIILSNVNAATTFGIAYPSDYASGDYSSSISDLGISISSQNVFWSDIEPTDNNFVYTRINNFVAQLTNNTSATIRISGRGFGGAHFGTSAPDYNVPIDVSIGGTYYDYIYQIVNHVNGLGNGSKVINYEMEWEADCVNTHWAGTYTQYAEMAHTFYVAVKAANPNVSVILGSANGDIQGCGSFTEGVLSYLSTNYPTTAFDKFDMHLYHHQRASTNYSQWYSTAYRVSYYQKLLNTYFSGKTMVTTEYGGPSPSEFDIIDTIAYTNLISDITATPCLMITEMSSYSDHLRMFLFNITDGNLPALNTKHDRIVGKELVYKSIIAANSGINEMFYWNYLTQWDTDCVTAYMGHPTYGKMGLFHQISTGPLVQRDSYTYYKKFISKVSKNVDTVTAISVDKAKTLLPSRTNIVRSNIARTTSQFRNINGIIGYDVTKAAGGTIKVIWEVRNLFYGESTPKTSTVISVAPWTTVTVEDLFGVTQSPTVTNGNITIDIDDTPIFITGS